MKFFPILFFVFTSKILLSQVSQEWTARYNNFNDRAISIAADNFGNVIVTGSSTGTGSEDDYLTIKYNSSGDQLWYIRYNGTGNSNDQPVKILVDDFDNSYVTGSSFGDGTNDDIATVKYDSSGVELWSIRYNGILNGNDGANSIAIDHNGNVFVTGYHSITAFNRGYITLKYNSSGILQWSAPSSGSSEAFDIKVDGDGNSYITAVLHGSFGFFDDIFVIKYDSSGNYLWGNGYNGPSQSDDFPFAISLDHLDNVFVTGRSIGNEL